MRFINSNDCLDPNRATYIFGAGQCGIQILESLVETGLSSVKGFVDSNKTGQLKGLPIISPEEYFSKCHPGNLILASQYYRDIIERLPQNLNDDWYNGYNYFRYLNEIQLTDVFLKNDFMFIEESSYGFCKDTWNQFRELLRRDEDKALLDLIIRFRRKLISISEFREKLQCHYDNQLVENMYWQYLKDVRQDSIKTVIDAGIHDGYNCLEMSYQFPNIQRIYGFEPDGDPYNNGGFKAALESRLNFTHVPLALWDKSCTLYLIEDEHDFRVGETKESESSLAFEAVSIDEFVANNQIKQVDYIKMDVEGAEQRALLGSRLTIKDHRPQLAISMYHSSDQFYEIPKMLMEDLNHYSFFLSHHSTHFCETILYCVPDELLK